MFEFPYPKPPTLAQSGKVLFEHIANCSDGVPDAGKAYCGGLLSRKPRSSWRYPTRHRGNTGMVGVVIKLR
jgi:hypothetical protein